jgi:hypothetical protein
MRIICFEGAASSSGDTPLYDAVADVARAVKDVVREEVGGLYFYTFPITSTREMGRLFDTFFVDWTGVVCIGKSLGAVRMFRMLNAGDRWERVERVISIDPTSVLHGLFGHAVKAKKVSHKTINLYQRDASPKGVDVSGYGAINTLVEGTNHENIVWTPEVRSAIRTVIDEIR